MARATYDWTKPYTVDEVISVPSTTTPSTPRPSVVNSTVDPRQYQISVVQQGDVIPYIFGETTVTPKIICAHASGHYLYVDYLIGVGEIEGVVKLFQNGEDIGLPTSYEFFDGTAGQSASTLMTNVLGSYDAMPGVAHFVARLTKDDALTFQAQVKGLKLFDPRPSPQTTAYSNNPALALARVLDDCGYNVAWDTVATVANLCDESVGGSKRWTLNIECAVRQNIQTWIQTLAQYASCFVEIQGEEVRLIPDAPVTSSPVVTRAVTASDIVAGTAKTTKIGSKDVPKQVIISYRELNGTQRTATVGSGSTGDKSRLNMPGFQTFTMAKRYATQLLNKVQADLRFEYVTFDSGLSVGVGDIHSVTYAPHGLSSKLMRVVDCNEVERGRWRVSLSEYDPALYSDTVFTAPSLGDTDLPSVNQPPAGPTPTVVEELYTDQTAVTYSRLKITWAGVSNYPYIDGYKVTVEPSVLNTMVAHDGAGETHTAYTAALKQGISYTVRIWCKSTTGALSADYGEATVVALGKLLPPSDVPAIYGYEAGQFVALNWEPAAEIDGDLRGYILKRIPDADHTGVTATDWDNTNAVTIAKRVDVTTFLTAQQPAGDYWFCVRAIDTAGNMSENMTCKKITVTADAGTISLAELNEGNLTNMHAYVIDGGYGNKGRYVITSTGETWADRFGNTSPEAAWSDTVTSSPEERWGGDMATDSKFESEIWALGGNKSGNWTFETSGVTLLGGTQANSIELGDNSSPISWTAHSGNSANAAGYNFRAVVETTDSPASAGDGLHIKLPVVATYAGKIINQSGTVVIADDSPISNPVTVTFDTEYSGNPDISLTVGASVPALAAADNVSSTGFDVYLWNLSGEKIAGTVYWTARGT